METSFSTNSWHAKLYKKAYNRNDLPENLCPYFWKVLSALALLPIIWLTFFDKDYRYTMFRRISNGILWNFMLLFFYAMGFDAATKVFNQGGAWAYIYAFPLAILIGLVLILCVFLVVSIIVLMDKFSDYRYKKRNDPKGNENLFVSFFKAKIGKYCPKINWK